MLYAVYKHPRLSTNLTICVGYGVITYSIGLICRFVIVLYQFEILTIHCNLRLHEIYTRSNSGLIEYDFPLIIASILRIRALSFVFLSISVILIGMHEFIKIINFKNHENSFLEQIKDTPTIEMLLEIKCISIINSINALLHH